MMPDPAYCEIAGRRLLMRIAFFAWEYPPVVVGGLGMYAENMARAIVELGHDVAVFALNNGQLPTREIMRGVEVHRPIITDASKIFPLLSEELRGWGDNVKFFSDFFQYNLLSASKLVNSLAKKEGFRYDLVSFHDWLNSVAGLITKDELKLPAVFHAHSTEWGRTGGGSAIVNRLEWEAATRADSIITVSHAMKRDLVDHSWPEDKIHVIWNGIDPQTYDPRSCDPADTQSLRAAYGIGEEDEMILFVGRLTWVKGAKNLVQAMPQVLSQHPKAKLVLLGEGEEQAELQALASRLGIGDRLRFRFQFVPERERVAHYAAADLCVFPSIYEPFGIVGLEAMAMEKPLVVGAKGVVGLREQVVPSGPDQTGIHVDGNSPMDIAWGIMAALSDRERARSWGRNGRRRVLQHFTWRRVAEQTISRYEEAIQARG